MATSNGDLICPGVVSFAHGHVNAYFEVISALPDARGVAAWHDDCERGMTQCDQVRAGVRARPGRAAAPR